MNDSLTYSIDLLILELNTLEGVNPNIVDQLTEALNRIKPCHHDCVVAKFTLVCRAVLNSPESVPRLVKRSFLRCLTHMRLQQYEEAFQ